MFKNINEFLEYLYTDYICGTDSITPELCGTLMENFSIKPEEVKERLKNLIFLKVIEYGIPQSKDLEFKQEDFDLYCEVMLNVPRIYLSNGVWIKFDYFEGVRLNKDCIGKAYSSEFEKAKYADCIGVVFTNGATSQISYPSRHIHNIVEITEFVTIKIN